MNINGAIFLSASVPGGDGETCYAKTADTVAIATAVGALIHVVLGRRRLVWGGHPAITPMVYAVAEGLGVDYSQWVTLYQSKFFEDQYPEDNENFQNVVYTRNEHDLGASLSFMRRQMFGENQFDAGVFIGGKDGLLKEFQLFQKLQPRAQLIPILSTGGATLEVGAAIPNASPDLAQDLDYVSLLHRHLGIPVGERRYNCPADQPARLEDRLIRPQLRKPGLP